MVRNPDHHTKASYSTWDLSNTNVMLEMAKMSLAGTVLGLESPVGDCRVHSVL